VPTACLPDWFKSVKSVLVSEPQSAACSFLETPGSLAHLRENLNILASNLKFRGCNSRLAPVDDRYCCASIFCA
jgi:hypothetical protein